MRSTGTGRSTLLTNLFARLLATRTGGLPTEHSFEVLESRKLLSNSPLPTLADLESPTNTVVRIETNYGDFDIELFNSDAPITVANFLNYVTSGRYDESFFHRSAFSGSTPFVLQGGGFKFDQTTGLEVVQTDAPIIRENTGRLNQARTVAMARTNAIDSATDQFFINYVDNAFLNPTSPNDGYAVFGRVINGWEVVQTIQDLSHPDLTGDARLIGDEASNFGTVPVGATYDAGDGVREEDLVNLVNVEIIKPAGTAGFFTQTINYPEGFRSGSSIESITLSNSNSASASYQVIVHYESGIRDVVVASGTISGTSSLNIELSDFGQAGLNLVRTNSPYSVEVQAAFAESVVAPRPVAATSNRIDFNGATSEDFFNPAATSGTTPMRTWDLPRIERNALSREFILYQNLSDQTATLTFTFRTSSGTQTLTRVVDAYRRGGVEVGLLGLPNGVLSARVTSTADVVVALSDWDLPNSGVVATSAYTPAFGVLGTEGGGSTTGGLGLARVEDNFTNTISLYNPGTSVASVTLSFWATGNTNATATTRTVLVQPGARSDFDLTTADLGVASGTNFSVTFSSGTAISAQYTSFDAVGRNAGGKNADGFATAFTTKLSQNAFFAGRLDPTNTAENEVVSILNPFSNPNITFNYTVRFIFSDGTIINGAANTLGASGRIDISTRSLASVISKISSGSQFRTYAIQVFGTGVNSTDSTSAPAAGFVTLSRNDAANGRYVATSGMPSEPGISPIDPVFTVPGPA